MMTVVMSRRAMWFGFVVVGASLFAGCGSSATPAHRDSTHQNSADGEIAGRVLAAPACPVQRVGVKCPPQPIVIEVQARAASKVVASARSGRDGTYRLSLPAGTYTIAAVTPNRYPRCVPRIVTVTAGRTTTARIDCDTGLR